MILSILLTEATPYGALVMAYKAPWILYLTVLIEYMAVLKKSGSFSELSGLYVTLF